MLVNSAYLAPPYQVAAIGSTDLYATMSGAPSFVDFVQARAGSSGIRISFAQPADVIVPAYAGAVNLRYGRPAESAAPGGGPAATGRAVSRSHARRAATASRSRSSPSSSACSSSSSSEPRRRATRSTRCRRTELTDLVANLNTRNDQLRAEIAATREQLDALTAARARGDTSLGQLQADLAADPGLGRPRCRSTGPGIQVTVGGPDPGHGRPGPPQRAPQRRRRVVRGRRRPGRRPGRSWPAAPGALSIEDTALGDPFEVDAIGNAATLTGSLTRAGGIVARLKATFPGVQITVTPVDPARAAGHDPDARTGSWPATALIP